VDFIRIIVVWAKVFKLDNNPVFMELDEIKAMGLQRGQVIEIVYEGKQEPLETRWGQFRGIVELPEGMTEVPERYRGNGPEPPFVRIAHRLDKNGCSREVERYVPSEIRMLKPF